MGQEAEVPDAHEALRKQVQQESAQELIERYSHQLLFIVVSRVAPAKGDLFIGYTHAREAVPILIGLLLDPDASIHQTAVSGLSLLTHRVAFDGNKRADVTTPQSASNVHQRWASWWKSQ